MSSASKSRPRTESDGEWWPVSLAQEATLIETASARLYGFSVVPTNFPVALSLRGPLDVEALEHALTLVVQRHAGLTAAYVPLDSSWDSRARLMLNLFQRTRVFIPGVLFGQRLNARVRLHVERRTVDGTHSTREALAAIAQREASAPLRLDASPIMRATLVNVGPDHHLLVLTHSLLTIDSRAAAIVCHEVTALYTGLVQAIGCTLPPASCHAGEFAAAEHARLRHGEFEGAVDFWRRERERATDSMVSRNELPLAPAPRQQPGLGTVSTVIGARDTAAIREFTNQSGTTLPVLVMSAVALWLQRCTGRRRVAFWSIFGNRTDTRTRGLVASCANAHLVALDVPANVPIRDLCALSSAHMTEAYRHQALPPAALPLFGVPRLPVNARTAVLTVNSLELARTSAT